MMIEQGGRSVIETVREHVDRWNRGGHGLPRLRVSEDEVKWDDGWLYVVVVPDDRTTSAGDSYDYYQWLTQIESELETEHSDLRVLLVPVLPA